MFTGDQSSRALTSLFAALALVGLGGAGVALDRSGGDLSVQRPPPRRHAAWRPGHCAGGSLPSSTWATWRATRRARVPRDVTLLAPVQQAGSALTVEVANLADKPSVLSFAGYAWPALLALAVWVYRMDHRPPGLEDPGLGRRLDTPRVGGPALSERRYDLPRRARRLPAVAGRDSRAAPACATAAPAPARLAAGGAERRRARSYRPAGGRTGLAELVRHSLGRGAFGQLQIRALAKEPPLAESVTQDIRVEDKFALATAKLRWQAEKGDMLPLLFEPTVLTRVDYPTNALKLVQAPVGTRAARQLLAEKSGTFDIKVQYELPVTKADSESSIVLPVPFGVVNRLSLTLVNLDVDVLSPQAVAIQRDAVGSNTVATLVLSPANDARIAWKPRSRDVKREKPVFYAEISQLYVPAAGVIEGAHYVSIRPAQGELSELVLDVPAGATITDVLGSGRPAAADAARRPPPPPWSRCGASTLTRASCASR